MERQTPVLRLAAMLAAASLVGSTTAKGSPAESPPGRFGDGLCAIAEGTCGAPPMVAVLSAFPAELAPLVERATVRETLRVGDRVLRVGTLGDVPVVLGLLGTGLVNAANTTQLVLDRFDVDALVVSGVAGSPQRIGDITAPDTWVEDDGASHPVDPTLLAIAREVAASPGVTFDKCTPYPIANPVQTVCLGYEPELVVGGTGHSSDPFGGRPFPCIPTGGEILGCDVGSGVAAAAGAVGLATSDEPDAVDEETAAVAREAQARGVPFIAFRAVSDSDRFSDPLGLPGFPLQFFAYYRLAADNAAAATAAFVTRWGEGRKLGRAGKPRPLAVRTSCDWERLATPACSVRRHAPRPVTATVTRCCRLLAGTSVDSAAVSRAWSRAARLAKAARPAVGRRCATELSAALLERAGP